MAGANENSHEGMGVFVDNCGIISAELRGALVIGVHHTGKMEAAGMRGWSGLDGACDAEWEVRSDGTEKTVRLAKLKDGDDNLEWGFALEIVEVGKNAHGEPVTTCVVNLTGAPSKTEKAKAKPKDKAPPRRLTTFERAFSEAMRVAGKPYCIGGDPQATVQAVNLADVRAEFSKRWAVSADDEGEVDAKTLKRKRDKSVSAAFTKITSDLPPAYRIEAQNDVEYIWRGQLMGGPAQIVLPAEMLD